MLYLSKQVKKQDNTPVEPIPIKAQLFFYKAPEPIIKDEPIIAPPTIVNPEPEPIVVVQQEPEKSAPVIEVQENVETNLDKITDQEIAKDVDEKVVVSPQTEKTQTSETNYSNQAIRDVVKDQLNSYQNNKLENMAAEAAKEYRKQLTSPTLFGKQEESFLTEDEKFEQKITTSVDCSSATNQTMATVMKLLGGRVKCSEPPPFDSFIQKRLNKSAHLPAIQDKTN